MRHVLDALCRLESLAEAGASADEVAHDAAIIAAGWWWDARGDLAPDRLVLLVQELRCWYAVASRRYALRWDRLERAGRADQADHARRQAEALDRASHALHVFG